MDHEPSLQEALRQCDDWASELAVLFGLDERVVTPPPLKPAPPRTRPTRKRERAELLRQLDESQSVLEAYFERVATTPSRGRDADALRVAWVEILVRQREQRFAAEVENQKLRKLFDEELKAAHRISALTSCAGTIRAALGSSPRPRVEQYNGPYVDLATHLGRLDELTREAQYLFGDGQFVEHAGRAFRDVAFRNLGEQGFMVELTASWVMPFTLPRVVEALWAHTTRISRREKVTDFEDLFASDRTLVSRFVSETKVPGTIDTSNEDLERPMAGSAHGEVASRCELPGPDGAVLVVSAMDVKNFRPDKSTRSVMRGSAFLLVEPLTSSNGEPASRIKWCRRMQGRAPDDTADALVEYKKWINVLTSRKMRSKWWSSIDYSLQMIENALLDGHRLTDRASVCG